MTKLLTVFAFVGTALAAFGASASDKHACPAADNVVMADHSCADKFAYQIYDFGTKAARGHNKIILNNGDGENFESNLRDYTETFVEFTRFSRTYAKWTLLVPAPSRASVIINAELEVDMRKAERQMAFWQAEIMKSAKLP